MTQQIQVLEFTLNSGTNKGHRRIWIEGNRLISTGFRPGMMLAKAIDGDRLILSVVSDRTLKKHSIAGTLDRPILDLCGKWVTRFMGDHPKVAVTLSRGRITIRPTT